LGLILALNYGLFGGVPRILVTWAHLSTLDGGKLENFQAPSDIVGSLAIPGIKFVFSDICKPSPFGAIVQMADSEILFDDVAHLGDALISSS